MCGDEACQFSLNKACICKERLPCIFLYDCLNCWTRYETKGEAVDCCHASEETAEGFECCQCGNLFVTKKDADSCCLESKIV
jgi:hypothetical protein